MSFGLRLRIVGLALFVVVLALGRPDLAGAQGTLTIISPTAAQPVDAGAFDRVGKITVTITKPRTGLKYADFQVTIAGERAAVISVYERETQYVLEVLTPHQSAPGTYDLYVATSGVETTAPDAVRAAWVGGDIMMLLDRSSSIHDDLPAVQDAAKQFADLMYPDDRLGLVSFDHYPELDFPLTTLGPSAAPQIPFADDVESGGGKWTADSPWTISNANPHAGSYSWRLDGYAWYKGKSLTSIPFDLSSATEPILSFWCLTDSPNDAVWLVLEVSSDAGATWEQVAGYRTITSTDWLPRFVSLSDYAGQAQVQLRFRNIINFYDSQTLQIDDVRVVDVGDTLTQFATAVDALYWRGQTTLGGAMQTAQAELDLHGRSDRPDIMVMLSDGEETHEPLVEDVLPQIVAAGTKVFTIGLGTAGEQLTEIAEQTGGSYHEATNADAVAEAYTGVSDIVAGREEFYRSGGSTEGGVHFDDEVPLEAGSPEVIWELGWSGDVSLELTLHDPSGRFIDDEVAETDPNIEFYSGGSYQMYRVRQPEGGTWVIHVRNKGAQVIWPPLNEVAGQAVTGDFSVRGAVADETLDVTLSVHFSQDGYARGEAVQVAALLSDDQPVLGAVVTAKVTPPASSGAPVQNITLSDDDGDGVYLGTTGALDAAGTYTFDVTATGDSNAAPAVPFSLTSRATTTVGAYRVLIPILTH